MTCDGNRSWPERHPESGAHTLALAGPIAESLARAGCVT